MVDDQCKYSEPCPISSPFRAPHDRPRPVLPNRSPTPCPTRGWISRILAATVLVVVVLLVFGHVQEDEARESIDVTGWEATRNVDNGVDRSKRKLASQSKSGSNGDSDGGAGDGSGKQAAAGGHAPKNEAEKPAGEADGKTDDPKHDKASKDMFSYHKDLLPLDTMDWVTFVFSAVGLVIAAGGGIGGGGILVPLYMILLRFRPKHAIALSNFTILGGSISNCVFNVQKKLPDGRGLIDWDIIVMMEPSTIAGAVLGSFASKYLPDFVLTVALSIVLGMLSYRTMEKGIKMFNKESAEMEKEPAAKETSRSKDETAPLVESGAAAAASSWPWDKVLLLIVCFAGCVVLTILKGSGHGSVIGVECGSIAFWILSMASVPWVIAFGALFRCRLVAEYEKIQEEAKNGESGAAAASSIKWDRENTIRYPLVCTLAGVFAGLFGVGGGIVKGPLMLEMGVNPSVAAATAAQMILFTTSAACVSFEIFGLLEPEYGILFFVMGIVCTAVGQFGINTYMSAAKRQSPPVLSIGVVMVLSTCLVAVEAVQKFMARDMSELLKASSICSKSS